MAVADRTDAGWRISALEPVGETESLIERLAPNQSDRLLLGFDFPIGLPRAYGQLTGFTGFREAIMAFGSGKWSRWFDVADAPADISVYRPFYPNRPGGKSRSHLTTGLGVAEFDSLLRVCDRKSDRRNAACAIFWTLGGSQVGKAAITGWQDVIRPALACTDVGLWPIDGDLGTLLEHKRLVIAETYPADAAVNIGIGRKPSWSKRKQEGRRQQSAAVLDWMARNAVRAVPAIMDQIRDGFGEQSIGEDKFDTVVGLLGMIKSLHELPNESAPACPEVCCWEGWILGQPLNPDDSAAGTDCETT